MAAFVVFVAVNGAVVVGDKSAHQPQLHLMQLPYLAAFFTCVLAPALPWQRMLQQCAFLLNPLSLALQKCLKACSERAMFDGHVRCVAASAMQTRKLNASPCRIRALDLLFATLLSSAHHARTWTNPVQVAQAALAHSGNLAHTHPCSAPRRTLWHRGTPVPARRQPPPHLLPVERHHRAPASLPLADCPSLRRGRTGGHHCTRKRTGRRVAAGLCSLRGSCACPSGAARAAVLHRAHSCGGTAAANAFGPTAGGAGCLLCGRKRGSAVDVLWAAVHVA